MSGFDFAFFFPLILCNLPSLSLVLSLIYFYEIRSIDAFLLLTGFSSYLLLILPIYKKEGKRILFNSFPFYLHVSVNLQIHKFEKYSTDYWKLFEKYLYILDASRNIHTS